MYCHKCNREGHEHFPHQFSLKKIHTWWNWFKPLYECWPICFVYWPEDFEEQGLTFPDKPVIPSYLRPDKYHEDELESSGNE